MKWTNTAQQSLEGYLERNRKRFAAGGSDAEEVMEDVRRHVQAEAMALRLPVVTEEDVQRIVNQMGVQEELELSEEVKNAPGSGDSPGGGKKGVLANTTLLFFGVIVPMISVIFELTTHLCAGLFLDPFPTWAHVLLVVAAVSGNFATWTALRRNPPSVGKWVWRLNGMAVGVSVFYAALFLPLTPFALLGVLWFGFGLVPLGPLCCAVSALVLRRRLRQQCAWGIAGSNWWWAAVLSLAGLVIFGVRSPITRHWMRLAAEEEASAPGAIRNLRQWGSREVMLQECYGMGDRLWVEIYGRARPDTEAARRVFYRVTGKPFNAFPPPLGKYQQTGRAVLEEFEWDAALGGDTVAAPVRGLSLASSRLDSTCSPAEGWAYLEWTMEFRNAHPRLQREARAQLELPPGAVVSRLTLWVNGEEREAAFAGRAKTREAYQQVAVRQRRDPVLVTTSGPDRVLMQCFPIAPDGGVMKVRLGITAPLIIEGPNRTALKVPYFTERNFGIPNSVRHSYWVQAQGGQGEKFQGQFDDMVLTRGDSVLRFATSPGVSSILAHDERTGVTVRQTLARHSPRMPSRLAVVLDGSAGMNRYWPEIRKALAGLPANPQVTIFLAQDGTRQLSESLWRSDWGMQGVGGQDPLPTLLHAWEWAAKDAGSAVLWIHGAQPVLLSNLESLKQRLEWRAADGPELFDLQVTGGPNRVAEQLATLSVFQGVPRLGTVQEDLDRLFGLWTGRSEGWRYTREEMQNANAKASPHIVRLWASEQVQSLTRGRRATEAVALAARHQLVTPVSGAVVLETQAQYAAAGLTPVDASTVPSVPEPQTWMLLAIAAAVALLGHHLKRRRAES